MRDCIFLLADKNMEAVFTGFLTREQFHRSLGTGRFEFDPAQDLIVDEAGNDPGVYTRAHELLRPYQRSHRYAVVVLDNAWDGSPGAVTIQETISSNLSKVGWDADTFAVIVIDPELEAWIWQDSPHVEKALRFSAEVGLRQWLEGKGLWEANVAKPADPKLAVEQTLKATRTPRSSAIYKQITCAISVKGCVDPAFELLKSTLQGWFARGVKS